MKVTVRFLRSHGKKLPDRDVVSQKALEGTLVTARVSTYLVAELVHLTSGGLRTTIATLYEPQLVQIRNWGLMLRGLEKVGETSYLQEWSCTISGLPRHQHPAASTNRGPNTTYRAMPSDS